MGAAFGCQAAASGCKVLLLHLCVDCIQYVKKNYFWDETQNYIFMSNQHMSLCFYVFGTAGYGVQGYIIVKGDLGGEVGQG